MSTRVVSVKLTDAEFALCREMSTFGRFLSVSDVLRAGLVMLAGDRKLGRSAIELAQAERNDHEPRKRPVGSLPGLLGRGKILPEGIPPACKRCETPVGCPKRGSKREKR
jgi:Arc/MetJ-type ribon-helix-helix transcriptional regulator